MKFARYVFIAILTCASVSAMAQSCPKVAYSTPNATLKSLVAAVNCMNSATEKSVDAPAADRGSKSALSVETFQIIGPQHTRTYRHAASARLIVRNAGDGQIQSVPITHCADIDAAP